MAKKKAAKKKSKAGIVKEVQIDRNKNGCYYWRQIAHNGEILSSAEPYSTWGDCWDTANSVSEQCGVPLIQLIDSKAKVLRTS